MQFESGQWCSRASVDSPSVQHSAGCVAFRLVFVRVTEDGFIAVCRRPEDGNPFTGGNASTAKLNRSGGHSAVGQQRGVYAQDFIDRRRKLLRRPTQPVLQIWMPGEIVDEDSDTCRYRSQLANRPVAQDRHDLVVTKRHTMASRSRASVARWFFAVQSRSAASV